MKKELAYNSIVNYLLEKSTFDIPEVYLNARLEEYQKLFQDVYCGEYDINTVLTYYYGTTLDKIKVEWASSLKSQIKAELVFATLVKDNNLQLDEQGLADYVKEIIEAANSETGNKYFAEEANIYKMIGAGNAEAGKAYFMGQNAVRDFIMDKYQ